MDDKAAGQNDGCYEWQPNGDGARGHQQSSAPFAFAPYVWRDPRTIPPRRWLYGGHYIRKFVSTTVAPGGLGKSSLGLVEAISMASGRALLGGAAPKQLTVGIWNGEDPLEELERRVAAILLYYRIAPEEINGRLFLNSGRTTPINMAEKLGDIVAIGRDANLVKWSVQERNIDVVIVDPFVSSHTVPENDNNAIDRVVKIWAQIADEENCAVELVHHVRKPSNGTRPEFTIDDGRGAVALINATRSARVLNVMSPEEASAASVATEDRRRYFRVDNGKSSMQPPMDRAEWRKLVSEHLDNADDEDPEDWVGVVTAWKMPGVFDGQTSDDLAKVQDAIAAGDWAANIQAKTWAGYAVGEALEIDASAEPGRTKVKRMLAAWIKSGALKEERRPDKKEGRDRPVIIVGTKWDAFHDLNCSGNHNE